MKGVLILNWYWFGRDAVLLDFQTEDEKLPWETAAEDARKTFLSSCRVWTQPIYTICGRDSSDKLCITFTTGYKDAWAAVMVLFHGDQSWVYFPNDFEWLEVLRELIRWMPVQEVLQIAYQTGQRSRGKETVQYDDLEWLQQNLAQNWKLWERYPGYVCQTMTWWMTWFLYACVAEENYRNAANQPTRLGYLIKLVALIEYLFEGWDVRDVCDHYKSGYWIEKYRGSGSSVDAVIEKCRKYGIVRE